MKRVISLALLVSSVVWAGGKEGGGGSFERLLRKAGVDTLGAPIPHRTPIDDATMRDRFVSGAERFLHDLRAEASNLPSGVEFRDDEGGRAVLTANEINLLSQKLDLIKRNPSKQIEIVQSLGSMDTGEEITALNIPDESKVLLGANSVSELEGMETALSMAVWIALAGHELLSLAKIEDATNYSVSATHLRRYLKFDRSVTCFSGRKSVRLVQAGDRISLNAVNFEWPSELGDKTTLLFNFGILKLSRRTSAGRDMVWARASHANGIPPINIVAFMLDLQHLDPIFHMSYDEKVSGPKESLTVRRELQFQCASF